MSRSVRFDRAAEYYDRTRGLGEEAAEAQNRLLSAELEGRGGVLEVGVGTGQVALRLAKAGVPVTGLDISRPMVAKLVEKAGGAPPFPLTIGDATALPFRDDAFGGVVVRWVLHLIADWRRAVREMVRVARGGGVLVVNLGGYQGPWLEIQRRFGQETTAPIRPVGLEWGAWDDLESVLERCGARQRTFEPIIDPTDETLGAFLEDIEENRYSWTWPLADDERRRAAAAVRAWAERGFGPLDRPYRLEYEVIWRAYDLP